MNCNNCPSGAGPPMSNGLCSPTSPLPNSSNPVSRSESNLLQQTFTGSALHDNSAMHNGKNKVHLLRFSSLKESYKTGSWLTRVDPDRKKSSSTNRVDRLSSSGESESMSSTASTKSSGSEASPSRFNLVLPSRFSFHKKPKGSNGAKKIEILSESMEDDKSILETELADFSQMPPRFASDFALNCVSSKGSTLSLANSATTVEQCDLEATPLTTGSESSGLCFPYLYDSASSLDLSHEGSSSVPGSAGAHNAGMLPRLGSCDDITPQVNELEDQIQQQVCTRVVGFAVSRYFRQCSDETDCHITCSDYSQVDIMQLCFDKNTGNHRTCGWILFSPPKIRSCAVLEVAQMFAVTCTWLYMAWCLQVLPIYLDQHTLSLYVHVRPFLFLPGQADCQLTKKSGRNFRVRTNKAIHTHGYCLTWKLFDHVKHMYILHTYIF